MDNQKESWISQMRPFDINKQSVDLENPNMNESSIRRNARLPNMLVSLMEDDMDTLANIFKVATVRHSDRPCMGFRPTLKDGSVGPYNFLTYREFADRVYNFAFSLKNLGLKKGDTVGIYSKNRIEWVIAAEACFLQGLVTVAIYDSFGPEAVKYVIDHSEMSIIISDFDGMAKIINLDCPQLTHIIQMDCNNDKIYDTANSSRKCYLFSNFEEHGKQLPKDIDPPLPNDLAVIMYTSGTTGMPKGVMHSHKNIVAACSAVVSTLGGIFTDDVWISYLPLAHIFERAGMSAVFMNGGSVGFYQGNVSKLSEDICELQPTLMAGVPRVFDRVKDKIMLTTKQCHVKQWIFNTAYNWKRDKVRNGEDSPFWNSIVFNKIKKRLGGKIRLIVSGGAPLSPELQEFVKVCFCCPVIQGYGLTETCAGGTICAQNDPSTGHVGPPVVCCEIKLNGVPEMNYFPTDPTPEGEILIRGPSISQGYFKDPEKTKEVFYPDGWFATGDIGRFNENGTISIIDRKKNIFKLQQGEYVAAEKLENAYKEHPLINQIWVYGDSNHKDLVAVIVPSIERLELWFRENGSLPIKNNFNKCAELREYFVDELSNLAKSKKFNGYEVIRSVYINDTEFSVDNDLITPTFKFKRPQLKQHFVNEITEMYEKLNSK